MDQQEHHEFNKGRFEVLHMEMNNLGTRTGWGLTSWKAAFQISPMDLGEH